MSNCPVEYWIWLQRALGAGAVTDELLGYFGDPENLYKAGFNEWRLSGLLSEARMQALKSSTPSQTYKITAECRQKGYQIITPESNLYPSRFTELRDRPLVLYGLGDCSVLLDTVSIGIVGTREASRYGIETAQRLSFCLAKAGVTIISGAALGIDSEAHAGAMLAKGRTAAFLGCGLSVDYLRENASLRRAITRYGAVFSEYEPFHPANRSTFPIRNRLISGLTLGTVVIEAGVKSGSLITAKCALEQGKDVFAVPGDVVRSSFDGTNHLIRQGAKPVFGADDILSEYDGLYGDIINTDNRDLALSAVPYVEYRKKSSVKEANTKNRQTASDETKRSLTHKADAIATEPPQKEKCPAPDELSGDAKKLWAVFPATETQVDDLKRLSGLKTETMLSALTELELFGLITETAGKHFVLL